ncbi:MAG TPA: hypothetical protein PKZ76_16150 [Xanthomonadaceae bacterium]|nr:hypothetical protein [Xanthomonadaceae bacterium]
MIPRLVLLGALACIVHAPAQAAIYTVGSDGACTHTTINGALLAAILNPGADTIRIATNATWTAQAVVVDNQSVTLAGGFPDCSTSTPTVGARTQLSGAGVVGGPAPVIRISNTQPGTAVVVLRDLRVTAGTNSGLRVSGDVLVSVERVLVVGNTATNGGGIHIDGAAGASVVLDEPSTVFTNTASASGGGVYCTGPGVFATRSRIWRNEAGDHGGGVFATSGCTVNAFPENVAPPTNPGISENRAGIDGGGIDASAGATVNLIGTATHSMLVHDNRALTGSGGGIRALGAGTRLFLTDTRVTSNLAIRRGGGIAVSNGAELLMERTQGCNRGPACSEMLTNSAAGPMGVTDNFGGAIAVWSGALARIESTRLRTHSANHAGAVFWVEGSGSLLDAEGVIVSNSLGLRSRVEAHNGGVAQFVHSTFFEGLGSNISLLSARNGGSVRLYSSLVAEQAGTVFDITGGGAGDADCVLAHEVVSMPPSSTRIGPATAASALIVGSGDPHLRPDSPAIDFCDVGVVLPSTRDMDGELRGFDRPERPNLHGPYDLGADEHHGAVLGPAVFANGFEAGG